MAIVSGVFHSANIIESLIDKDASMRFYELKFTMAGTYAQADNGQLLSLPGLLAQAQQRQASDFTVVGAMAGRPATLQTANGYASGFATLKSVALSGSGLSTKATFELAGADFATEIADGAIPAQSRPYAIIIAVQVAG